MDTAVRLSNRSVDLEKHCNAYEKDNHSENVITAIAENEEGDNEVLVAEQADNNCTNDNAGDEDEEVTDLVGSKINMDSSIVGLSVAQFPTDKKIFHHRKRRKRKQTRPRSICETETSDNEERGSPQTEELTRSQDLNKPDTEIETKQAENDSEEETSKEIKHKPLCSKLCIRRDRRAQKSPVRKEPTITSKEITEIINATNENTNSPCTTNRYRRHFLKQLRKAEARRLKEAESKDTEKDKVNETTKAAGKETDETEKVIDISNDDVESEEDLMIGSKRIKIDSDLKSDEIDCSICHKKFNDVGKFMAHYICHSSFEKAHISVISHAKAEEASMSASDVGSTPKKSESTMASSSEFVEESTYFCHVCNQRFTNITSLQSHMTSHPSDTEACSDSKREFYCHQCHKKFASAGSLHVHNKIHTGDNPYTCLKCKKSFRDKTRLTTHIRVHTGEKPFTCSVCYKSFSQKGNLKLHQKIHTGEKDCLCKVCGSCFRLRSDLVRHMKVHGVTASLGSNESSLGTELSADENQASYSSSEDILEQSVRDSVAWMASGSARGKGAIEESDTKAKPATITGFSGLGLPVAARPTIVGRDQILADLTRVPLPGLKPEEKTLMLSIDSEVEFIKAMTTAKLRAGEDKTAQTIPCPLCGIVLTSVDNLNHHVLLHHNPLSTFSPSLPTHNLSLFGLDSSTPAPSSKKYYRCKECSVDFSSFPEFQLHMESHSAYPSKGRQRDAKCSICNVLVAPDDLADHVSTHTGEKVYSCAICARVFRRSHHLQTHLRTHTGDRPYICADCGKCFVRGDHLQNHRRTHTGEKPYKCDVCSKSYSQSHHLLRHKRTHTGERPYRCALCEKTFSRDHHLKKHMETHNCVIFPEKSDDSSRSTTSGQNPPIPTGSMVTRSSNRIAQIMSSLTTEHSASRLMESMVQRHLQEQEKASCLDKDKRSRDCCSTSTVEPATDKGETDKKPLKIADILDDAIPLGPQISEKLVVDHVIKATRGTLGRSVIQQNGDSVIKNDDKDLESSVGKQVTLLCTPSKSLTKSECSKSETNSTGEIDTESANDENLNGKDTFLTLEDIVNQRLKEEYNLAD